MYDGRDNSEKNWREERERQLQEVVSTIQSLGNDADDYHLQVHLHQFGQVIGSAEKPRVARQSAEHCPAFIVNRAEQLRLAEKRIVFGGHDPVFRVKPQRIVGQRIGSERLVECLFQVRFKITACLPRHKLRVQVKR